MIEIEKTDFDGDKNHYLYIKTPYVIENKIKQHLAKGIKPTILSKMNDWDRIAFESDVVLYPDKKNSTRTSEVYEVITDAITALAFAPGGIEIFGYRYEAKIDGRS